MQAHRKSVHGHLSVHYLVLVALAAVVGAMALLTACGSAAAPSGESNTALVKRLYTEVLAKGNMTVADEVLASSYVDHRLPFPDLPGNREGLKQAVSRVRAAFPDITPTVEDVVAAGDKVAVRATARGTHQKEFNGIPATGKQVTLSEMHIFRVADGKIVEHWGEFDSLGLLVQLGAFPPPAPPK